MRYNHIKRTQTESDETFQVQVGSAHQKHTSLSLEAGIVQKSL